MAINTYPYQNRSLADIKGEIWDDVPGYEGEYQVSNLGRIKSLRRWKNSGTQSGYYTTEMIRKSIVRLDYNAHIKKNNYLISITLKSGGICHTTAIARYVYYVFVKPFDIDNPGNIVSYKDHDGRNVKPENLYLTTRKKLTKLSHQLGRSYSSWYENKIPVVQFDISSRVVATFSSITEAAQAVGGNTGAIVSCTKGRIYQHKGFRWRVVSKKSSERKKSETEVIFNRYLWTKIGRPETSEKNPIPVLNLSQKLLKGERWKFIEGLNNAYQLSNLGRIKSVARFKHNYNVWAKDHIQRLIPDSKPHRSASSLLVQLSKDGKKIQQSVARLVYFHFVKRFDLSNKAIKVGTKDGCFYNLTPKNLYLKNKVVSK